MSSSTTTSTISKPQFLTKESIFYDLAIFFFNWLYSIFFREIKTRGSFNVPTQGPVIFVCAPHANQFVDPSLVMLQVKKTTGRNMSFLVAGASFRRRFVGFMSKLANAIPVERVQDNLKLVSEDAKIKFEDFANDPTLIVGENTHFTTYSQKSLIGLPEMAGNSQIDQIFDDTHLKLRKPFTTSKAHQLLTKGTVFKYAEKIDNSNVFKNVFNHLHEDGAIGIYPEGGSHDRTELLPLKPGVAIMALGAVAENPEKNIQLIPVGVNYFHPNKFRSRAVVEFGRPIVVTAKDGESYKENTRETVSKLLEKVTDALKEVVVTCPDYDILMTIQAARRLYQIPRKHVPLPLIVEMNRRLAKGYVTFQDDPRVVNLTKAVNHYNKNLSALGLKDHQLINIERFNSIKTFALFITRFTRLLIFSLLSLPGTILFSPVFIVCKIYSRKKAKEALAKSVVKINATDVLATWKLLCAMAFAPILYVAYSILGTWLILKYNYLSGYFGILGTFITCYSILVLTTYSAFRIGEVGMDIFKSLKPLMLSLTSDKKEIEKLKQERDSLSLQVTQICNELGPDVFPDFDEFYKKGLQQHELEPEEEEEEEEKHRPGMERAKSETSSFYAEIKDQQKINLSDVAIFSDDVKNNRNRSRSSSATTSTSGIDEKEDLDSKEAAATGMAKDAVTNKDESKLRQKIKQRFIDKNKNQLYNNDED